MTARTCRHYSSLGLPGCRHVGAGGAQWRGAFRAGVDAIQFYGGAAKGMRTMLDALVRATPRLFAGLGLTL